MISRRRDRRRSSAPFYTAIGLAVIAVTTVAVSVSYRAANGLPFEAAYKLTVDVPTGNRLVATNEVRIGGVRIGRVVSVKAMPSAGAKPPYTRVRLALDGGTPRLPVDSRVAVRPSSALGATFVDLAPGARRTTVAPGGRIPLANARPTVDLVDLFDIFDDSTSRSIQSTFSGLGGGLAGRGAALNESITGIDRLLPAMRDASKILAAPGTRLPQFVRGYEAFAGALDPVREPLGALFTHGAATFAAFDAARTSLGETVDVLPSTERVTTDAFRRVGPSLDRLAGLVTDLRAGGELLPGTLRRTDQTLREAVRPFAKTPALAEPLGDLFTELRRVSRQPSTDGTVRKLTEMSDAMRQTLEVLTPAQVNCDVIGLWGVDFGKEFAWGGGDTQGLGNFAFATAGAENSIFQNAQPSNDLGVNYLPHENADECESGNEPSPVGGPPRLSNPSGLQSSSVPLTTQPPGVRERAARAGLQDLTGGDG